MTLGSMLIFPGVFVWEASKPPKKLTFFGRNLVEQIVEDSLDMSCHTQVVEYIPPGKDRWLATPISLGLSWSRIQIATELGSGWRSPSTFIYGVPPPWTLIQIIRLPVGSRIYTI